LNGGTEHASHNLHRIGAGQGAWVKTSQLRGEFSVPRALAAFVKRPQAALLKSALTIFYRSPVLAGQTNVISFYLSPIEIVFFWDAAGAGRFFFAKR
jgi:hypothetical protein